MTPEIISAVAAAIVSILVAIFAFNKWVIAKFLSELKPNGGGSMRDKVDINTERLTRVEIRVDEIYHILATKGRKTNAR